MQGRFDQHFFRTRAGILVLILSAAVLLWAVVAALRPLPGRHLVLAAGAAGSDYAQAAERYRSILARDGVHLRIVTTNGAVENLKLLSDPHAGIDVGFVQAGSVDANAARDLQSLGTMFYEAVWFFCRCESPPVPLPEHPEWRVSIGPVGSATRVVALKLMALNGLDPHRMELLADTPEVAARELLRGQLNAALLLSGWDSPVVQSLARAPGITLIGFPRADAYVALDPTLSKIVLPRGVADLAADRPPKDTVLIASKASLAVRRSLHPALQYLLVQAAIEVHSRPGIFQRAGEFPAAEAIDLPLSAEARQIYRSGPSFLQRSLPFWLADLVQRVLILVLPVAGIIYPLWSFAPRIYNWEMRRRIYRMYRELKLLEFELQRAPSPARRTIADQLDDLDRRALELHVPSAFTDQVYGLRSHIHALRETARSQPG